MNEQLGDNGHVVSLHRDLAEANGQLREMKNTMTEILRAMDGFRLAIEGLKAWQSAMSVESRVDKSEIQALRETISKLEERVEKSAIKHEKLETKLNTLRWVGGVLAGALGFLSANREWLGIGK